MQLGTHLKSAPDTTLENFFFFLGGGVFSELYKMFSKGLRISLNIFTDMIVSP